LVGYIKTLGVNNIVQICKENVLNMSSAIEFVTCCFPSLYFQGYVIHFLDLLVDFGGKKMGKLNCEKGESYFFSYDNNMCH
jgi:hypothetical protein